MDNQILIMLLEQFLNEKGMWFDFKEFVENQGFDMEEIGLAE